MQSRSPRSALSLPRPLSLLYSVQHVAIRTILLLLLLQTHLAFNSLRALPLRDLRALILVVGLARLRIGTLPPALR